MDKLRNNKGSNVIKTKLILCSTGLLMVTLIPDGILLFSVLCMFVLGLNPGKTHLTSCVLPISSRPSKFLASNNVISLTI